MQKIIFLDTSDVGARYTAEASIQLGFEPIFLINLDEFFGDTKDQISKYHHYHVDTKSINELIKVIQDNHINDIAGVMTMLDSKITIAIELSKILGVNGMDPALVHLASKAEVVKFIPNHGPMSTTFNIKNIREEQINDFVALTSAKTFLLKPARAAGGVAVHILENTNVTEIINYCNQYTYNEWVLCEFIQGDLLSVEGFVLHQDIKYLGVSLRKKIKNTETASYFYDVNYLSDLQYESVKQAIKNLVATSDYKNGYFHTEFMINKENCYLIDANFGRVGGAAISEIIAKAYGLDPIEIFKHVILITLFNLTEIKNPYHKISSETMCIQYGIPVTTEINGIVANISEKTRHTILLNRGNIVTQIGENNWSWVGILSGNVSDVLDDITKIKISTKSGEFNACYYR